MVEIERIGEIWIERERERESKKSAESREGRLTLSDQTKDNASCRASFTVTLTLRQAIQDDTDPT